MRNSVAEVIELDIVERFITVQIDKGKSELTAKTYRQAIEAFDRYLKSNGGSLNALTRHDVQTYLKHLEAEGKSAATLNKVLAVVCVFAKFLKRPEIVEDIRSPEVRKVSHIAPKCLERNELNRLLREVERKGNQRDTAIVITLLHTGLRVSELVALDRRDIIIGKRSGSLVVRNGKGNVARTLPLSPEVRLQLSKYLEQREDSQEALFLSNYQQRISVRAIQHLFKSLGTHPQWKFYIERDNGYFPSKHDDLVLKEAAEKFNITPEQANEMFQKVSKEIADKEVKGLTKEQMLEEMVKIVENNKETPWGKNKK